MAHEGKVTGGGRQGAGCCLIGLLVVLVLFVGGGVLGYAHGPDAKKTSTTTRPVPAQLCTDLGSMAALLPPGATHDFTHTSGGSSASCEYKGPNRDGQTFVSLQINVFRSGSSFASDEYDRADRKVLTDRPYPTKLNDGSDAVVDDADLDLTARRDDTYIRIYYLAHPVDVPAARRAVLAITDRVVWLAR